MADQPPPGNQPPPANAPGAFAAQLQVIPEIRTAVADLSNRLRRIAVEEHVIGEFVDVFPDQAQLATILLTGINGSSDLPEQKVEVEYLRTDQRLKIPAGLGQSVIVNVRGIAPDIPQIRERFLRAASVPYRDLRARLDNDRNLTNLRNYILTRVPATAEQLAQAWVPRLDGNEMDDRHNANAYYTALSQALQLNYDVRDTGILNHPDMRLSDDAWQDIDMGARERLRNRLHPWSLQCIAALNYEPCRNNALAGWVRAYGLGFGLLPDADSVTVKEYQFVIGTPNVETLRLITEYERTYTGPAHITVLCMNILAMFGLFHLNKDHTFRSSDANMDRIGTSYINALRTLTTTQTLDAMLGNKEEIVRTAPHPFGLAQTYWLAKFMAEAKLLASPLEIRKDVTPPPVQRVMIAFATQQEWSNMPAGQDMNMIYRNAIEELKTGVELIKANPPAYSSLHRLYGIAQQIPVAPSTMAAANSLMPTVYGYAEAFHTQDDRRKDGVALALSLINVARDCKALADAWSRMWRSYIETMDTVSIVQFARDTLANQQVIARALGGVALPG